MNYKPFKRSDTGWRRYSRQLDILGESGQQKLKGSSVAVIGLGGLGSPAVTYLAMAGLGKLVLSDDDRVALSNLNRQFLHWNDDISCRKSTSAREKLKKINPDVTLEIFESNLTDKNLDKLPEVDLIIGSVDNFRTRYLLNKRAVDQNIPYIHGAVEGLRGQLTTIVPGETPCLRCIFPDSPPGKTGGPILGTTAGLIGSMMANEAIKFLAGQGNLITGKLLIADIGSNEFDKLTIRKNPDCPVCGK